MIRQNRIEAIIIRKVIPDAELFESAKFRISDCYNMVSKRVTMNKDLSYVSALLIDSL
jgi:hypothetical protein